MSHKFPLAETSPQLTTPFGTKTQANKVNFPILRGLALYRLSITESCFREPHWHANADEVGYCLSGKARVTIFVSGNVHARFLVSAGEMYFIPSGSLHAIENLGQDPAEFVITFSHEQPEDFGLSGFVGCLSPAVIGNTWGLNQESLEGLTRSPQSTEFGKLSSTPSITESDSYPSPYKFAIESRAPLLSNVDGSARRPPRHMAGPASAGHVFRAHPWHWDAGTPLAPGNRRAGLCEGGSCQNDRSESRRIVRNV